MSWGSATGAAAAKPKRATETTERSCMMMKYVSFERCEWSSNRKMGRELCLNAENTPKE
jgi:hypothetical protein